MRAPKVVVMGGGVAGLTVAHELLERGFTVTVLERRPIAGGKARSFRRPPQTHGGGTLSFAAPVEHGFHFFPGFYKNLDGITGSRSRSVRDAPCTTRFGGS